MFGCLFWILFFFVLLYLFCFHLFCNNDVCSGVRVTRSLVLCAMLCRSLLVPFVLFVFWPVRCLSYGFRFPLWYFQPVLAFDSPIIYLMGALMVEV